MKATSLCILLTLCPILTYSQQFQSKTLQGKVVAPGEDVTAIAIQNLNSKQATITDFEGNFSIVVKQYDTLVFSAVHLKKKVLPITKSIFNSSYVRVPMEAFVNELSEVVVQPFDLSGNLNTDAAGMDVAPVTAESLGLPNAQRRIPTQSERKLMQASFGKFNVGMILSPPLDPIINMITGRTKMLKNRVAVDKKYARTNAVQNSITDSLFLTELRIPKDKIADFMYFCEVDAKFQQLVELKDKLKLWEYLLIRSKLYRENNGLE